MKSKVYALLSENLLKDATASEFWASGSEHMLPFYVWVPEWFIFKINRECSDKGRNTASSNI